MNMFTKMSEINNCIYRRAAAVLVAALMAVTVVLPLQTAQTYAASSSSQGSASAYVPATPQILRVTRSENNVKVKWKKVRKCSGYQVQCSRSPVFLNAFSKKAKSASKTSRTIKNFGKGGPCYVRLRTYRKVNGKTYWSPWAVTSNARKSGLFQQEQLKKGLTALELREAAGQEVFGYDTVQGSCYYGGFVYYILENRYAGRCKIVKLQLATRKVVKVSEPLNLHHGNGMTFNYCKNEIVVAHSTGSPKTVSVINPFTLKIKYNKKIIVPKNFGLSKGAPKYTGFGAIAYNGAHNGYVILLRGSRNHNLVILDANFRPVKYMKLKVKINQTVQAIDSYGEYILAAQSSSSGRPWNNLLVYDWNGNYQFQVYLSREPELESIFHDGNQFYASYYSAFYERKFYSEEGFFKRVFTRNGYIYKIKGL